MRRDALREKVWAWCMLMAMIIFRGRSMDAIAIDPAMPLAVTLVHFEPYRALGARGMDVQVMVRSAHRETITFTQDNSHIIHK